jgi:hypothetical protein
VFIQIFKKSFLFYIKFSQLQKLKLREGTPARREDTNAKGSGATLVEKLSSVQYNVERGSGVGLEDLYGDGAACD